MPSAASNRSLPWHLVREHRWLVGVVLGLLLVGGSYRWTAGFLGARLAESALARRLGVPVAVASGRAGLGTLTLLGVVVGGAGDRVPLAQVATVRVSFAAAWGGGTVDAFEPHLDVRRGGPDDNVAPLIEHLTRVRAAAAKATAGAGDGAGPRRLPAVTLNGGSLRLADGVGGRSLVVGVFDASLAADGNMRFEARQISGAVRVRGREGDPVFGAGAVEGQIRLSGLRPLGYPSVRVHEGYLRVSSTLALTGITGTVTPAPPSGAASAADGGERVAVDLAGSWAGARRALWTATGNIRPSAANLDGSIVLRAERFSLDKVADVLPASVLKPASTFVDANLDLRFSGERVGFSGGIEVSGLNLRHDGLAREPVLDLGFGLRIEGAVDIKRRRLEVAALEGRLRHLVGRLDGFVELVPGSYRFTDGSEMPMLPKIELHVKVPKVPCAKLLGSVPLPLVPHLRGFELVGQFEADIRTRIDYQNLEALELGGKVGIDGCRVVKAPAEVAALAGPESVSQVVDVPPAAPGVAPGEPGSTEIMVFAIGPDNPDFVPFEGISPHLINSIMTTEDSGFFRHHGFVTPEFKTALRRNLAGGGFRLGASSITMQMVKNVLLSQEKTLSRKLQELFLVWFLEGQLPKERILELYFNAIEFGPRLYGIGPAARHYFGKTPAELSPLEAAFFSSILPSPKRRYIQFCHGSLYPPWDKYVRRILARVHERGRMTDEEYAAAAAETVTFSEAERTLTEKQCLDWIKKITTRVEADPPDSEAP